LVSNMPGPPDKMYIKDSQLLAAYPISTITPGGGVNITMVTYSGKANIGLVCCNNHIDSLEPLADYCLEAFDMLERCIDDLSLSIDDIGEKMSEESPSIIDNKSINS